MAAGMKMKMKATVQGAAGNCERPRSVMTGRRECLAATYQQAYMLELKNRFVYPAALCALKSKLVETRPPSKAAKLTRISNEFSFH